MKKYFWIICKLLFLGIVLLAFSPIVLPMGVSKPEIFGLPYTLWFGLLISILFILLTILGSVFIDSSDKE